MCLEFQQTEGERQQNQWAENKNFTNSVNQHIVLVQDTLNTLKTAAAVREEKITKAVNNGDKAAGQLKNIMKKIATYASLPGKIETVTREQVCRKLLLLKMTVCYNVKIYKKKRGNNLLLQTISCYRK